MITEITEETTVKEICEVFEFMNEINYNDYSRLELCDDMSGSFWYGNDGLICDIKGLPEYIATHTPKTEFDKFMSLTEEEFSSYIYDILEDDEKRSILREAIRSVIL